MAIKEYTAEIFDSSKHKLGESPYYDPRYQRYSWVDITEGKLWTLVDDRKACFKFDQPIGAAIPIEGSKGFLLAAKDGLYVLEDGKTTPYCELTNVYKSYWRSNDAKADKNGRVWFGATALDGHDAEGNLYLLDGGEVKCMQPGTKISNGMAWSKDQKSFFFSDSLEYAVFKYDYDLESGKITGRKVLFNVENGVPDGMCIDADDNLWVAIWDGSRIEKRSSVTGEKLAEIHVPALHTSSCNFINENRKWSLLITSAGDGLDGEYDGCIFKCHVDEQGINPDYVKIN